MMWPAAVLVRLPLMIGGRRIRADLTSLFRVAARDSDLARQRREGYQPKGNALGFERIIHLLSLVFRHRIANNSERARVKRSEAPRIGGKQVIEQHDLELPDEHVQLLSSRASNYYEVDEDTLLDDFFRDVALILREDYERTPA